MRLSWLSQLLYGLLAKNLTTKCLTKCQLTRYFSFPLMLLFLSSVFPAVLCDDFTMPLGFEINSFHSENNKNLVSKNGVFAFGFLDIDVDVDDEYVVGVKYNLGDKFVNLPVWTVGGGLRVSSNSTFKLAMDGSLVLMDNLSKITMWSSNTSNLGVKKATLLDNGNFVLLGNKNEIIWESFDSPTNTLLPGQSLRYPQNLRALSTNSISSYYSLVINGELKLMWEHNVTYWRSQFSSNVARFDSNGIFGLYDDDSDNKAIWFVTSTDYGDRSVTLRHLRIDRDGNLRIYSWDDASRVWKPVWRAVEDQCSVFGSCGLYSVCGYDSSGPVCDCLDVGSSGVDSGGVGCRRMADLTNCKMRASVWVMKQTVLYGLYPSHDVEMSLSETGCKEFCKNDTGCVAATSMNDGSGRCTIKRTNFISGYKNPYIRAVSFLKVCSVPQAVATRGGNSNNGGPMISSRGVTSEKGGRRKRIGDITLIVLLTVLVVSSIQMLVFSILYRKRKIKVRSRIPFGKDDKTNTRYSVLVRLSFEEIKELTDDFADRIGPSVFRGALPNKMPIVAKVLTDTVVSEKEFRVTVSILSGTHHRNLVSVKGFCFEQTVKCLLYEYVPNGSLDKWLFDAGENRVEQIRRRKVDIALGIARGLAYLHLECQKCITHGNLKLENVLLDENLVPKLTDFGLRDFHAKQTGSSSESPSERDIYALGRMFLQIVTCEREVLGENTEKILEQVSRGEKIVDGDRLEAIERIVRISFWCMLSQPFLRPSIGEVVKVLEGTLSVDRPPSRLASRRDVVIETEILEAEC